MAQEVVRDLVFVIKSISSCVCTICVLNIGATRGVELWDLCFHGRRDFILIWAAGTTLDAIVKGGKKYIQNFWWTKSSEKSVRTRELDGSVMWYCVWPVHCGSWTLSIVPSGGFLLNPQHRAQWRIVVDPSSSWPVADCCWTLSIVPSGGFLLNPQHRAQWRILVEPSASYPVADSSWTLSIVPSGGFLLNPRHHAQWRILVEPWPPATCRIVGYGHTVAVRLDNSLR